jgi:hypothetical protein
MVNFHLLELIGLALAPWMFFAVEDYAWMRKKMRRETKEQARTGFIQDSKW